MFRHASCVAVLAVTCSPLLAQHRVVTQGNGKLVVLDREGRVEWELPWEGIHDVQVLPNGHFLVQQGPAQVVEIDPAKKEVVWSYDSATANGNAGKPVEVHSFQPLGGERLMIAESGPGRIIEIDRAGRLLCEIKLQVDHPHPHTDTRLVRKLANEHYLVCHEGDGAVREYDRSGQVAWEYAVPLFGQEPKPGHGPDSFGNKCFAAVRLSSGSTLIATGNGHSVLEVTPEKEIVWKLAQNELPGITLAWVTTLEVLPDGHYLIGNCHAGPGQPLLIELEPNTKKVIWTLDQFELLGNSVSNSQALDTDGKSLR